MTDNFLTRRLLQVGGLALIADGVMGLINPRRRSLVWHAGPELAKALSEEISDNPKTARAINLTKTAIGLLLFAQHGP